MPIDFSNPKTLKFMTESFDKENAKRTAWFIANQKDLIKLNPYDPLIPHKSHSDIRKATLENCLPMVIRQFKSSQRNRRKRVSPDGTILGMSAIAIKHNPAIYNSVPEPKMKPVEEEVARILRRPQPEGGRRKYLKERLRKTPEDRYNFCETSNNVYGWELNKSKCIAPVFGRVQTYHRSVKSLTGPQPDPTYYQQPLPITKCNCF